MNKSAVETLMRSLENGTATTHSAVPLSRLPRKPSQEEVQQLVDQINEALQNAKFVDSASGKLLFGYRKSARRMATIPIRITGCRVEVTISTGYEEHDGKRMFVVVFTLKEVWTEGSRLAKHALGGLGQGWCVTWHDASAALAAKKGSKLCFSATVLSPTTARGGQIGLSPATR